MNAPSARQQSLHRARRAALGAVLADVEARRPLVVLKAPPGSGKTHVLLRAAALAQHRGLRVAVATQTNSQADDLCRRLGGEFPAARVHRFTSQGHDPGDLGRAVTVIQRGADQPAGASVVVATSAKWASTRDVEPADVLLVDEAWQMAWGEFTLLSAVAPRFVLVGDPGQIEPTVTVPVARWETSPRAPHRAAPAVILADAGIAPSVHALPVTTRLPHDTAALVRGFYDFPFDAWGDPGARRVTVDATTKRAAGVDDAIELLAHGSLSLLTLPTPDDGAPADDRDLAATAADVVRRLLDRRAVATIDGAERRLTAADVGVVATHRATNARVAEALGSLAGAVRVDTPERWQGLEREVMVAVHPLSSATSPTGFDLATGRLCVMLSRHRAGLVVVSRDHVGETLAAHAPAADQAPGAEDANGRGHAQHTAAWRWFEANGRVARAA
ncbi:MAG: AAA family ATPase [Polyangiales bacterium]